MSLENPNFVQQYRENFLSIQRQDREWLANEVPGLLKGYQQWIDDLDDENRKNPTTAVLLQHVYDALKHSYEVAAADSISQQTTWQSLRCTQALNSVMEVMQRSYDRTISYKNPQVKNEGKLVSLNTDYGSLEEGLKYTNTYWMYDTGSYKLSLHWRVRPPKRVREPVPILSSLVSFSPAGGDAIRQIRTSISVWQESDRRNHDDIIIRGLHEGRERILLSHDILSPEYDKKFEPVAHQRQYLEELIHFQQAIHIPVLIPR